MIMVFPKNVGYARIPSLGLDVSEVVSSDSPIDTHPRVASGTEPHLHFSVEPDVFSVQFGSRKYDSAHWPSSGEARSMISRPLTGLLGK